MLISNIFIGAGILTIGYGIIVMIKLFKEEQYNTSDIMYGWGYLFGCFAGAFIGLIGITLALIGMLIRN